MDLFEDGTDFDESLVFFLKHGHWVIRKVPNTKDDWYVACGDPPARVLKIYGIPLDWFERKL